MHSYVTEGGYNAALELALWKSKLDDNDGDEVAKEGQRQRRRKDIRVTSGANIVIKNVLPFLALKSHVTV